MVKIKSKKYIMIFLCLLCLFFLSGCEFKLFEKIDDSENLGDIDDDAKAVEKEEKPTKDENEDYITVSKVKFEKNKESTLYCKLDTWGYSLPVDTTKNKEKQFDQGAEVKRIGLSIDGTWAMIENGNSQIYLKTEMLSVDKVKTKAEIEAEEKAKREEEERKKQEEEQKNQEQNNNNQPSGGTSSGGNSSSGGTVQKPKPPVQGGIPYTGGNDGVNFGVVFANANFTAKVVSQCSANTGPGKAVPSTGYEVIQWFYAGDSVQVTGIGQNGYIRVSVGGRIGFINNTCLTK